MGMVTVKLEPKGAKKGASVPRKIADTAERFTDLIAEGTAVLRGADLSIEDGTGVMPESVTDATVSKAEAEAAELRDAVSLARMQERERQAERAQVEMLWKWHTLKTVHPSLAQQIDALWETVHGSRR